MSYKHLNDSVREAALVPFLQAASELDGHLVAIAVDKRKKWLSSSPAMTNPIHRHLKLRTRWKARALEDFLRKIQFMSTLSSLWTQPYTNITWITDQDEIVVNDARHDDTLLAAGTFTSIYSPFKLGVLRINSTHQDLEPPAYEDVCSVPDLAAGMLSEICTQLAKINTWGERFEKVIGTDLPFKAAILADWFWDDSMRLRKTLVTIDVHDNQYSVKKIAMKSDSS